MKRVQRWDSYEVKAMIDENGFLSDDPIVARIGSQEYLLPDGSKRVEFRPASEVFNEASMSTFKGKPITLGHKVVNSENVADVLVGSTTGYPYREWKENEGQTGNLRCPLSVFVGDAIRRAQSGEAAELSVGYTSIDINEPGWGDNDTGDFILDRDRDIKQSEKEDGETSIPAGGGNWVRFDAVQTNIVVNHIAMVFRGRAGVAKLNLDSEQDFPYIEDESKQPINKDSDMKTIKIDGVEIQVAANVAAHVVKLDEANTAVTAQLSTATAKADQLQAQVDGFQAKLDAAVEAAVAAVKVDAEALGEVKAFAETLGVKCDGMDLKGIKVACIKELSGIDASQKDDAYINSSFDFARESDKLAANRVAVMGARGGQNKGDAADAAVPDPQKRFRK